MDVTPKGGHQTQSFCVSLAEWQAGLDELSRPALYMTSQVLDFVTSYLGNISDWALVWSCTISDACRPLNDRMPISAL